MRIPAFSTAQISERLYLLSLLVLTTIIVLVSYAYGNTIEVFNVTTKSIQSTAVLREVDALSASLLDREASLRGALLSSDDSLQMRYHEADQSVERHLNSFQRLTRDHEQYRLLTENLIAINTTWKDTASKIFQLKLRIQKDNRSIEDYESSSDTHLEQILMDQLKDTLRQIRSQEENRQFEQSNALWQRERFAQLVILGLGIASIPLSILLILVFASDLRARQKSLEEIRTLNADLEHKVIERTIELQDINTALEEEISERQAAQEELRRSSDALAIKEAHYRGLFDNIQSVFAYFRTIRYPDGTFRNLQCMDVNPAFEKAFGFSAQEAKDKMIDQIFQTIYTTPFDWIGTLSNVATTGQPISFTEFFPSTNRWYHLSVYSPEKDYVACNAIEVTESKLAEEQIQESRERYAALLKQSSDAIVVVDPVTCQIREINASFLKMSGLTATEVENRPLHELQMSEQENCHELIGSVAAGTPLPVAIVRFRRKDGTSLWAERALSLISHRDKHLILLSFRDVTEQQRLQTELHSQVELAGTVQRSLLPPDLDDGRLTVRTLFRPLNLVSGDYYGYRQTKDGSVLHGFIMDVTGHGVAPAIYTATISSLLNEAMNLEDPWTIESLTNLNKNIMTHFPDTTFCALFTFTLDLTRRTISFAAGGINHLLLSSRRHTGLLSLPGIFYGVTDKPEYEIITYPVQQGDTFYFLTDGLSEKLPATLIDNAADFESTVRSLRALSESEEIHDDCSALCLRINALPPFPLYLDSPAEESRRIRLRLQILLTELTGEAHSRFEIALGEALTNAASHGTYIRTKVNRIGKRLILRIRDDGPGFRADRKLQGLKEMDEDELFDNLLEANSGRGIAIMLAFADHVLYNKAGNEIMLVKRL